MQRSRIYYFMLALSQLRARVKLHFLRDYDRLVTGLLAIHRLDKAMAIAVGGGDFEKIGATQRALLTYAGLTDGMSLVDFGCGSGRTAAALGRYGPRISYFGIDISRPLLEYAKSISPSEFRFTVNRTLTLPLPDQSTDMICAFSVFTHLKHTETYIYLNEINRILRPGGRLIFSFLEFASPRRWPIFTETVENERKGTPLHLNEFIDRSVIDLWASKLGFRRLQFIGDNEAPWGEPRPLGQSIAILARG
jgi:ubiquinone/menaquinone biosynthesis C-methylase UbiE